MGEILVLIAVIVMVSVRAAAMGKTAGRKLPGAAPQEAPRTVSGKGAQTVPEKTPRAVAENVPRAVAGEASQTVPEKASRAVPVRESARMEKGRKPAGMQQSGRREDRLPERKEEKPSAIRYWDGDPIPAGIRLVSCAYCGAENLIPESDAPEKYHCYFCREELRQSSRQRHW